MKADPQRQAVYDMEAREFSGLWNGVTQPMKQLRGAAREVCKLFDVPPVTLAMRRFADRDAEYNDETFEVSFGVAGHNRNMVTLAHEISHHIVYHRHGNRAQDHGPTFVLVYAQVLSAMRMVPIAGMRDACKRHKVRIARWIK